MIEKIIIVDDSENFRQALSALLHEIYDLEFKIKSKIIIEHAANGEELLQKIETQHIKLRHFLRKCGYNIKKAQNVTESTFFIKSIAVDVVIVDKSVIKHNSKFISQLLNNPQNLKIILINSNFQNTEIKLHHSIFHLKKGDSPEKLVEIIEQ
ncbi:MAG: hypothetical protein B6I20_09175 [Bacteroidetes bacterium 4572_117]|nr:MAG: hypothetical protein B6I20_09175 [Bacteroidetes bacterium 4572_117]